MPTKRTRNTPGKTPRANRNTAAGKRARSRATRPSVKGGFSASQGFSGKPPAYGKATGSGAHATGGQGKAGFPEVVLTRRNLLIGAAAIGGVATVGGGLSFALDSLDGGTDESIAYLSVPENAVVDQGSYTLVDSADCVSASGSYQLPYGTLVWADNDTLAACLVPTDAASPLSTVSVLNLSSGNTKEVLSKAEGADEGFEIIDVRCAVDGIVWVESNAYESTWRVYTARLDGTTPAQITQVDSGDGNWNIPSIAAVDDSAFWQVVPKTDGNAANERAALKAARFGEEGNEEVYSSKRAFATRVTAAGDGVVIAPRADSTGIYYQLTKISAADRAVVDQLTLPASMQPDVVAYGRTGFSFGFASIYSYGGGIANLGTYTPTSETTGSYDNLSWFRFSRSPITAPCWCGGWFVVKSTTSLCGVDFTSQSYFAIDTVSGSDDYGEHLVSSGSCTSFVGLSQIAGEGDDEGHAVVRVFTPKEN